MGLFVTGFNYTTNNLNGLPVQGDDTQTTK